MLTFSKNSPIIEPTEDGLIANLKESIQLNGKKILSKIQNLNSEHVTLVGYLTSI